MNERIRELWTQAEKEIQAEYEDESRRNRRLYNEIFLPKFAELIVKECIDINKQELSFSAFERLMNKYKDHFGVEEESDEEARGRIEQELAETMRDLGIKEEPTVNETLRNRSTYFGNDI